MPQTLSENNQQIYDNLKSSIEKDFTYYKDNVSKQQDSIKYYQLLLSDPVEALKSYIENLSKEAIHQREFLNNHDTAKNIDRIMKEVVVIRDLKKNDQSEILAEFATLINNLLSNSKTKKMSETQLSPEQEKLKSQYLKTLDYLGFNPSYHEPNITKAIKEGHLSFVLHDAAKDNKNVKYELALGLNSMANGKVTYKAENLANGHKIAWPQLGAPIPKKEATEGLLTGGYILTDLIKKDGEKYKVWMGIDKINPPITWDQANRIFEKDKKCVQTHSGAFAKIPTQYFAHEFTKKDIAILLNGKEISVTTVDFKTGEKLIVDGLKIEFKTTPEGKTKFDFTFSQKKGTGEFISTDELQNIKDAIKQGKSEPAEAIDEQNNKPAQTLKEKEKIAEKVVIDNDDEDAPKKKKKTKLSV